MKLKRQNKVVIAIAFPFSMAIWLGPLIHPLPAVEKKEDPNLGVISLGGLWGFVRMWEHGPGMVDVLSHAPHWSEIFPNSFEAA